MSIIKDKQIESISIDKIIGLNNKKLMCNKLLNIISNFSLDENGILLFNKMPLNSPKLIEAKSDFSLDPLEAKSISIPIGYSKYDIRTLYFFCNTSIHVDIYDNSYNGFLLFSSSTSRTGYFVINIPCEDKSTNKNLNVVISNHDNLPASGTLNFKLTTLI